MILQRLASAITRQDWFQVVIEVLIVIVGIFLGLQVQAWYEEQGNRALEITYLERLHSELENAELLTQNTNEAYNNAFRVMDEFLSATFDKNENVQLGGEHCFMITRTHIFLTTSTSVPTMLELVSSGQLSILSDTSLRALITNYLVVQDEDQNMM